ncbi:MAG: dihydroorotase [bacterium]
MTNLYLKNVRVIDPLSRIDSVTDFIIRDGVIQPPCASREGLPSFDATGLLLAPGFWDTHVHFRDPGNSLAETRQTGARAAAAGGFTHVVTMPNTTPAGDSIAWLQNQLNDDLPVTIHPSACMSVGRLGHTVSDIEILVAHGAVAFTDDGSFVVDDEVMREAMMRSKKVGKPLFDHAVVPLLAKSGVIRDCDVAAVLNLPLFPAEAEIEAIVRDVRLCRETGCTLVIQHISTAGGVELIRQARAEGLPVFAEASPHHLALAAEDIPGDDGNWRMNPPLGTRKDRAAIRKAVMDGTITLFATDHAPHSFETKSKGFLKAPFGVIGLENAIGVTWKIMVEEEGMSILNWVSCWTLHPAELLKQPPPTLAPGQLADLVLVDPATPWVVNPETFQSKSRNCPFSGQVLHARAVLTVCNGRTTWRTLNSQPQ